MSTLLRSIIDAIVCENFIVSNHADDRLRERMVNMLVDGKHTRVLKWIHGDLCVVRVEVDAIVPTFDSQQPYLEPAVLKLLDRLQQLANAGQVDELERYGQVYVRKTAGNSAEKSNFNESPRPSRTGQA